MFDGEIGDMLGWLVEQQRCLFDVEVVQISGRGRRLGWSGFRSGRDQVDFGIESLPFQNRGALGSEAFPSRR